METIKEIAADLGVSKQAVWQRVKRNAELSALLAAHSEKINGTINVDSVLAQAIRNQYPDRNFAAKTAVNVDETTVNVDGTVDETTVNVDVNTLIVTLQNTVDSLKSQLTVKDKQIDELTAMLKASQEQQEALTSALTAAQMLHAGTMQKQLTMKDEKPVGFFGRLFRKKKKENDDEIQG